MATKPRKGAGLVSEGCQPHEADDEQDDLQVDGAPTHSQNDRGDKAASRAGEVAVPQADELQGVVERAGLGAPRAARRARSVNSVCLRRCSFLGRYSSSVASAASSSAWAASPAARAAVSTSVHGLTLPTSPFSGDAGERLGTRPQRRPVAEREPRAPARRRRARAARRHRRSRGRRRATQPLGRRPGGGASKRTPWQREVTSGAPALGGR